MKKVILVFVKLKTDINKDDFEAFEKRVGQYNIKLPSHLSFKVLRTVSFFGDEQNKPTYDYLEIIDIESIESLNKTSSSDEKIKAFMDEFNRFAQYSDFVIMDTIVNVTTAV